MPVMLIRRMTGADAEEVSALIERSYDRVLVHYHSPELIAHFREHATPESLIEQLGRNEVFVVEDAGRIVATGGLGWFDDPGLPSDEQAAVFENAADRRVSNLFVAVDLIGRGIGRTLLDHLVRLAQAEGAVRLHVASSRNAVSFYERAGFRLDPDTANEVPEITWLLRLLNGDS
jgi:GNAT superfamily N-acetyltransferase